MNKLQLSMAAALSAVMILGGTAGARADDTTLGDLTGRWILGDGGGVLVIDGSSWFHPKAGAASIRRGRDAANFEVHYRQHQGVRCKYQVNTTAYGEILVLQAADATQPPAFCPTGRLPRVSR